MVVVSGEKTAWDAWSQQQADVARQRHDFRSERLQREQRENEARLLAKAKQKLQALQQNTPVSNQEMTEQARKQAIIKAAIARATANKTQ